MKRGEPLKRKQPMARTQMKRKRRDTGPAAKTKEDVWYRASHMCERCGTHLDPERMNFSIHHRKPRGMGGTKSEWANDISNLLLLCGSGTTGCHGHIESNREEAYESGWLLRANELPWETPVVLHGRHPLRCGSKQRLTYLASGCA